MNKENPETPEYIETLEDIATFLSRYMTDFQKASGEKIAYIVHEITGLDVIAGIYLPPKYRNGKISEKIVEMLQTKTMHCWNYDPNLNLYIDLMHKKHNPNANQIEIILPESNILIQTDTGQIDYEENIENDDFTTDAIQQIELFEQLYGDITRFKINDNYN